MCLVSMANDGGLQAVLDASELVSQELIALSQQQKRKNNNGSTRGADRETIHDLAAKTNGLEVKDHDDSKSLGLKRAASRSLSELSSSHEYNNVHHHHTEMNLSIHTSQELKRVVSPLMKKMEEIDAAALLSLNPTSISSQVNVVNGNGAQLDSEGERTVPPIHDKITPSYNNDDNIVRYLHVKEVPHKYSAGIFVFPPNAEIPLHDHPDMVVLSRVLYGELHVRSFTVVSESPTVTAVTTREDAVSDKLVSSNQYAMTKQTKSASSSPTTTIRQSMIRSSIEAIKSFLFNSFHEEDCNSTTREEFGSSEDSDGSYQQQQQQRNNGRGSKNNTHVLHAEINPSPMNVNDRNVLSAPNVTCLFPEEGNFHSFVAGPHGAAVLDVSVYEYLLC